MSCRGTVNLYHSITCEQRLRLSFFSKNCILMHCLFLQIQEEEYLLAELKKIEIRKKERERRQQDLQKLITAAESTTESRLMFYSFRCVSGI